MVGITVVTAIVGIVLVQRVAVKAEEDLHAKLSKLESQFKVLTQYLEQEEEKLTQRNQQQEKKLTQRLQQEEEKMSGLQKQVDLLKRQLDNVTDMQFERKSSHFGNVADKFQRYGRPEKLKQSKRHLRSADPDEVAFTAELGHVLNNVPIHTIVRFDHTNTWTDNSYDPSTGVFTCPTSGLYLFAVFIETNSVNTGANVDLMMEGTGYMSVISERSVAGEDDTGGNVVLLSVKKGQRVWVETVHNDNQSFWTTFTTFSGVLIHRH